jgi:hypothetical protein
MIRSACFPQFFANDSSDRVRINSVSRLSQVFSQGLIDHRLVPSAGGVGPLSERLEHVVVDVNRDARLAPLTNHRSSLALAEVVFLFHIGVSHFELRVALKSAARHDFGVGKADTMLSKCRRALLGSQVALTYV